MIVWNLRERAGGICLPYRVGPRNQHALGQAVAAEPCRQRLPNRGLAFVAAGADGDGVARMIVEDGQRMAAPGGEGKMALEVHLPQLVRRRPFETLPCPMLGALGRVDLLPQLAPG